MLYYRYSKLETLQSWHWEQRLFDDQNHTVAETETFANIFETKAKRM